MRAALLTPLPPARTGIAHYASMVIPALGREVELQAVGSAEAYRREAFDLAIYQLGNNPHHEWIYREAIEHPGVSVLHDVVLHHLIVEMTLARGDVDGFVRALEANHGEAGAAWARGRAIGLHTELANFLFPASIDVANRSCAVIVHNLWAKSRLESFGVKTPIHVVPHPYVRDAAVHDRSAVRARLGAGANERLIGFFGFVTSAKRAEVVLEAFARARAKNRALRLLIAGEPAPNIDPASLQGEGIITTGYVSDEEFGAYYAAVDRVVNLRYPTAGETSGTLIHAFAHGKPVAVNGYAQFAEFPDDIAVKIPFGDEEIPSLTRFMLGDLDETSIANAQRAWLEENATLDRTINGYMDALRGERTSRPLRGERADGMSALPLFPRLEVTGRSGATITLRNAGATMLAARVYGTPAYRLIAKLCRGGEEIESRWIQLPRDLAPGDEATVEIPSRPGHTLKLYHALESVPLVEPEAWYAAAI